MKKLLYILGGIVLVVVLAFVAAGVIIPSERSFTQVTEIEASPETVWAVLNDREKYLEWQDQLTKIEITDETHWTEYPKNADPLKLTITGRDEGRSMDITYSMDNGFEGSWRGELSPRGEQRTLIRTTDKMVTNGWIMKIMMAMFFDIEDFAKDWNQKLKKRCEDEERVKSDER